MIKNYKFCPYCGTSLKKIRQKKNFAIQCNKCEKIIHDIPQPVAVVLAEKDEGIILVKRNSGPFKNQWMIPRAKIRRDDNPKQVAFKGIKELTGLQVNLEYLIKACNPSPEGHPVNEINLYFKASVTKGKLQKGKGISAVKRFNKTEAAKIKSKLALHSDELIIDMWLSDTLSPYFPKAR